MITQEPIIWFMGYPYPCSSLFSILLFSSGFCQRVGREEMEKMYFQQTILLAVNALVKILMGKETETMGQNETFDVYMNFIFLHNLLPLQKGELIV